MTVLNNLSAEVPSVTKLAQHLSLYGLTAFTALRPAYMESEQRYFSHESRIVELEDINNDPFSHSFTATVLSSDLVDLGSLKKGISTNVFSETEENFTFDDDDFVVRPYYTKEFEIKVGSLKIDRSLPKIFLD